VIDLSTAGVAFNASVLMAAAGVILWTGVRLAALGDRLADRLGIGEAMTGMILIGLVTALPGLAASITAALEGRPALAISNAIGGIAIQTTFLAAADIAYRKANLEHAAASVANMIQTIMLIILLTLVLLALSGPDVTVVHVHPMTIALFIAAGAGFVLVYRSGETPMWRPKETSTTVKDVPDEAHLRLKLGTMVLAFVVNAVLVTAAGALVAHSAGNIADETGLNETIAGGLLSGVVTSLPELVTTVAAVRRGALTLAISDIIGGNFFDVLFVFAADLVFFQGSIYHAAGVGHRETFLIGLAIVLNAIFLLGLLYRQPSGPANIGFESVLILVVYLAGFVVVSLYL
jgi:cation:H+ antiporter